VHDLQSAVIVQKERFGLFMFKKSMVMEIAFSKASAVLLLLLLLQSDGQSTPTQRKRAVRHECENWVQFFEVVKG
jgi:hypothetical protein